MYRSEWYPSSANRFDDQRLRCSLKLNVQRWTRTIIWSKILSRFLVWGESWWSWHPHIEPVLLLAAIKSTHLVANANRPEGISQHRPSQAAAQDSDLAVSRHKLEYLRHKHYYRSYWILIRAMMIDDSLNDWGSILAITRRLFRTEKRKISIEAKKTREERHTLGWLSDSVAIKVRFSPWLSSDFVARIILGSCPTPSLTAPIMPW